MAKILKSQTIIEAARDAKILGVRAGAEHRYTGIWVVVVEGRIFCRSWNDKPTGWLRSFKKQSSGYIKIGDREIPVRAKPVRSVRIRTAVSEAFAQKYNTPASRKWVDGFAEPARLVNTIEFVPE